MWLRHMLFMTGRLLDSFPLPLTQISDMVIKNSSQISEHSPLLGLDLEELGRAHGDCDEHGGEDVEELWGAIQ